MRRSHWECPAARPADACKTRKFRPDQTGRKMSVNSASLFACGDEAMDCRKIIINGTSHDLAQVVEPIGGSAERAGHMKPCVAAIHVQQEAVRPAVTIPSRDLPGGVDPPGKGIG